MKQIRYNIFETNSSATHVFSFNKKEDNVPLEELRKLENLKDTVYDVQGSLTIYFKDYGWIGPDIISTHDKLMYIAQLILTGPFNIPNSAFSLKTEKDVKLFLAESGKNTEKHNRKILKERIEVLFNLLKRIDPEFDRRKNPVWISNFSMGYINHQACTFCDFFKEDFTDTLLDHLAEFILNPKTRIYITNDNTEFDDEKIFKYEYTFMDVDPKIIFDPYKVDPYINDYEAHRYVRDNFTGGNFHLHKNYSNKDIIKKPIVYSTVIDHEECSIHTETGMVVVCNYTNKIKNILKKHNVKDYIIVEPNKFKRYNFFNKNENNTYDDYKFLLNLIKDKTNLIFIEK